MRAAYERLHALGWAHSVEVWDADGTLAGGLYGVELGGLFAAESKFHVRTDASKVAVVALAARLREAGGERVIDVQWTTPHLARLGARDVPRRAYVAGVAGGAGAAAGVLSPAASRCCGAALAFSAAASRLFGTAPVKEGEWSRPSCRRVAGGRASFVELVRLMAERTRQSFAR